MADSLSMSSANPTSQQLDPGFQFVFRLSLSIFLVSYSLSQEVMWGKHMTNLNLHHPRSFSYWPANSPVTNYNATWVSTVQRSPYLLTIVLSV